MTMQIKTLLGALVLIACGAPHIETHDVPTGNCTYSKVSYKTYDNALRCKEPLELSDGVAIRKNGEEDRYSIYCFKLSIECQK